MLCLQEKVESVLEQDIDGMSSADVKYGDSFCYLQHISSGLWVTYMVNTRCYCLC